MPADTDTTDKYLLKLFYTDSEENSVQRKTLPVGVAIVVVRLELGWWFF